MRFLIKHGAMFDVICTDATQFRFAFNIINQFMWCAYKMFTFGSEKRE